MPLLNTSNPHMHVNQFLNSLSYFLKLAIFTYIKLFLDGLVLYNGLIAHKVGLHILTFVFRILWIFLHACFSSLPFVLWWELPEIVLVIFLLGWHWSTDNCWYTGYLRFVGSFYVSLSEPALSLKNLGTLQSFLWKFLKIPKSWNNSKMIIHILST